MRYWVRQCFCGDFTLEQSVTLGIECDTLSNFFLGLLLEMYIRVGEVSFLLSVYGLYSHEVHVKLCEVIVIHDFFFFTWLLLLVRLRKPLLTFLLLFHEAILGA